MLSKPFRSPLIKKSHAVSDDSRNEPSAKKQRISSGDGEEISGPRLVFKHSGISSLPRKPFTSIQNPAATVETKASLEGDVDNYYNVLW